MNAQPRAALGIDTSNYTTSAAVCREGEMLSNVRRLLPVPEGALGLRQSDAVFEQVRRLPGVIADAMSGVREPVDAVGVSDRPCGGEKSYMPCFLAGVGTAKALGSVLRVPVYTYTHQQGHIAAALLGAGRTDLLGRRFLAFHVSGGTTEALWADENLNCTVLSKSLDLKAGQAVDRVGKMLGLPFPAGAALDTLAQSGHSPRAVKPVLIGDDCSLSGLENQCRALFLAGEPPENIAAFLFETLAVLIGLLCRRAKSGHGDLPVVFSGGVMRNTVIRRSLEKMPGSIFCPPEFSSDNAAGVAYLARREKDGTFGHHRQSAEPLRARPDFGE